MKTFLAVGQRRGGCVEGYRMKNVTPYMHLLVYHVPNMFDRCKHLKQFSGQGMLLSIVKH